MKQLCIDVSSYDECLKVSHSRDKQSYKTYM